MSESEKRVLVVGIEFSMIHPKRTVVRSNVDKSIVAILLARVSNSQSGEVEPLQRKCSETRNLRILFDPSSNELTVKSDSPEITQGILKNVLSNIEGVQIKEEIC